MATPKVIVEVTKSWRIRVLLRIWRSVRNRNINPCMWTGHQGHVCFNWISFLSVQFNTFILLQSLHLIVRFWSGWISVWITRQTVCFLFFPMILWHRNDKSINSIDINTVWLKIGCKVFKLNMWYGICWGFWFSQNIFNDLFHLNNLILRWRFLQSTFILA